MKINAIFDEKYFNEECNEMILYFTAPIDLIESIYPNKYPEAVSTEISLTFSASSEKYVNLEADKANVSISPTNAEGEDYDWNKIEIDINEIQKLIFLSKVEDNQLLEELKTNIYIHAGAINSCADDKDLNRNHVNYGCMTTYSEIIRKFGVTVECSVWEDSNGCLRVPKITIGNQTHELISGNSESWKQELKIEQPKRRQEKCR